MKKIKSIRILIFHYLCPKPESPFTNDDGRPSEFFRRVEAVKRLPERLSLPSPAVHVRVLTTAPVRGRVPALALNPSPPLPLLRAACSTAEGLAVRVFGCLQLGSSFQLILALAFDSTTQVFTHPHIDSKIMPHLEYNVDGVTPSSRLNAQQIQDFYVMMRESVWKISLPRKKTTYNGVCIRTPDGSRVIITTWLNWDEDEPIWVYSREGDISFHEGIVFQDVGLGLTYLAIDKKVIKKSPYVRSSSSNIGIGTSLYTIVHGLNGGEPMLFVGKTSFPFHSGKSYANSNRTPAKLLEDSAVAGGIPLLPLLKENLSLIQAENLECGLGSPVFNANGRLIGIVAFQFSTWNMVIPSSYIKKLMKHVKSYLRKKARR